MYLYKIYGLYVKSDIKINEACYCKDKERFDIVIKKTDMYDTLNEINKYVVSHRDIKHKNEEPSMISKVTNNEAVIYIPGISIFKMKNGTSIEYMPEIKTDTGVFRQWLLNLALGIIAIQRNKILIHGSGILNKERDCAFIISGDSGSGKSTLSNELLLAGYHFMADDAVPVDIEENEEIFASGAFPSRRLCVDIVDKYQMDKSKMEYVKDGSKEKYILSMSDSYFEEPVLLKKIFIIKAGNYDKVKCAELKGMDKVNCILYNLYKRNTYKNIGVSQVVFKKCVQIAKNVEIYELYRPITQNTVKELVNIIEKQLNKNN